MRVTLALLTASSLAAVVSASSLLTIRQTLPNCAAPCITGSSVNFGGCSPQDNECLCNSSTFVDSTTTCIEQSCTGNDLTEAEQFAQALCASVGVTLTATPTPSATSPSSSSKSSSTSSSASSTATQKSGAMSHSANAVAGLAAVGLAALML